MITKSRLNLNIDTDLKAQTAEVLSQIGLDFTTAVNLFFNQVVKTKKIPFELRAERYYTPEEVFGENWRDGLDKIVDEWE